MNPEYLLKSARAEGSAKCYKHPLFQQRIQQKSRIAKKNYSGFILTVHKIVKYPQPIFPAPKG
jgi:hypothetical protein